MIQKFEWSISPKIKVENLLTKHPNALLTHKDTIHLSGVPNGKSNK